MKSGKAGKRESGKAGTREGGKEEKQGGEETTSAVWRR